MTNDYLEKKMSLAAYSVDEVAELLGVSRDTAYAAARSGQIPSIRIGKKRILIPKAALDQLLREGNNQNTQDKAA